MHSRPLSGFRASCVPTHRRSSVILSIAVVLLTAFAPASFADERDSFRVCWSIYVGWMPWGYGAEAGIVDKWADKYGIDLKHR